MELKLVEYSGYFMTLSNSVCFSTEQKTKTEEARGCTRTVSTEIAKILGILERRRKKGAEVWQKSFRLVVVNEPAITGYTCSCSLVLISHTRKFGGDRDCIRCVYFIHILANL